MKKLAPLAIAAALATSSMSQTGCYGSYSAFNAVHHWNGGVTGSKVANSVIHFGLWVIPVYELAIVGDWLIFNNIEFLTGKRVFK